MWHYVCEEIPSSAAVRGEGGVASEGRLVDVSKLHSWGDTTNIQLDWVSHASSGLWASVRAEICRQ